MTLFSCQYGRYGIVERRTKLRYILNEHDRQSDSINWFYALFSKPSPLLLDS
jgi:hypothetical protein